MKYCFNLKVIFIIYHVKECFKLYDQLRYCLQNVYGIFTY